MELTPSQKKTVRHQFDRFCKKILREEVRDYFRHISWRSDHEASFSELSEEQLSQLYVVDEYPSEQFQFQVHGIGVMVNDEKLAGALAILPDEKRDIILLAYFLDMTDQEIGEAMNLVRRTVQYKRTSALKEMKRNMEVNEDGEES